MGVNDYFGPRRTNRPHATTNYGPGNLNLKLIITDRHIFLQKFQLIIEKKGKSGQKVMFSSKYFNSNYMEFVGYETCDKLIWTPGKGFRNKNTISKQDVPKINMNMTSTS